MSDYRYSFLALAFVTLLLSGYGSAPMPVTKITVEERDFVYNPVTFIVPVNQAVSVDFKNTGLVEHDFVIEKINLTNVGKNDADEHGMSGHDMGEMQYDLHVSTLPGQSSTVEFTPTEAGTYEFFCTVKGHREAGMIGKIVVVSE